MDERWVVTCFLEFAGRILIVRRSPRVSTYPGCWSAISGTIDPGRTAEQQAWQEIREETTLAPPDLRLMATGEPFSFVDPALDRRWTVYPFRFAVERPEQVRLDWENLEARWIDPAELTAYPTVPYLREVWERVAPVAPVASVASRWPAPVALRVDELAADRTRGASELASEALDILALAARSLPSRTTAELHDRLVDLAATLANARPTMAPIAYWTNRALASLPRPDTARDTDDVPAYRRAVVRQIRSLRQEAQATRSRIIAAAARLIRPGSRVATASYSSLVAGALQAAPTPLHVSALASLDPEGRSYGRLLVDQVAKPGLTGEVVPDTDVAAVAQSGDLVLLGADAIWPDGSIVNGVPSHALAEAAQVAGCPVYVLAEPAKALSSAREPSEPGFEVVPAGLITRIVAGES